jgi:hypothetical protein
MSELVCAWREMKLSMGSRECGWGGCVQEGRDLKPVIHMDIWGPVIQVVKGTDAETLGVSGIAKRPGCSSSDHWKFLSQVVA